MAASFAELELGQQLDAASQQLEKERAESDRLAARLKELGVDPSSV